MKKATEVTWVQEESMNQGAFQFAKLHVDRMLEKLDWDSYEMQYVGRKSVHSFCTGASSDHKASTEKLWKDFKDTIM